MGWAGRLFRKWTHRGPRPAWVSPQFLSVAVALAAVASFSIWHYTDLLGGAPTGEGSASQPQSRQAGDDPSGPERAYVGFDDVEDLVAAVQASLGCDPACQIDRALDEWRDEHPGARILDEESAYDRGVRVGVWINFEEPEP